MTRLRVSAITLQWFVGAFCAATGALMLIAPHQFESVIYDSLRPALALWGGLFFAGGAGVTAAALFRPRAAMVYGLHALAAAPLLALAHGFISSRAMTGIPIYTTLALGTLVAPAFATHATASDQAEDACGTRGGSGLDGTRADLLLILFGVALALNGVVALAAPASFSAPWFVHVRPHLVGFGVAFIASGVALIAAQMRALPGAVVWVAHVPAAVCLLAWVALVSLPYRLWTGVLFYGLSGTVTALGPLASRSLPRTSARSFRTVLAAVLVAAVALPLVVLTPISARHEAAAGEEEALRHHRAMAEAVAEEVADYVGLHRATVDAAAGAIGLARADARAQRELLLAFRARYPGFDLLNSFDAAGAAVARGDDRPATPATGGTMYEAVRTSLRSELQLVTAPSLQRPVVALGAPVLEGGELRGLVIGALTTTRMVGVLERVNAIAGGRALLVDEAGRAVAHPDAGAPAFADLSAVPPVAAALEARRAGRDAGSVAYRGTSGAWLAGYAVVPGLGWAVVVERPAAVALAAQRTRHEVLTGVLLFVLGAASVAGAAVAGWLTAPLARLGAMARALAEGDTTAPLPRSGIAEVRAMAEAFGEMRERLARRTAERETALRTLEARSAALAESEQRFRAMFENAATPVVELDLDGRPLRANPAYRALLGYDDDELRAMTFATYTHPDDLAADQASFHELAAGRRAGDFYRMEKRFVRKDGVIRWGNATRSLVRDVTGAPAFVIAMVVDITALKETEEALRASNAELEQFAYTVSHDLKAPLVSIQGYAHWLTEDYGPSLEGAGREYLERIEVNASKLNRLIQDVLAFSRVGRVGAAPTTLDLAQVMERCVSDLDGMVRRTDARMRAVTRMPVVVASPTLLEQVLYNLVANALTYGVQPGQKPDIEIGCDDLGNRWRLFVRDHGPGIAPEQQEQVFRLFERLPHGKAANPEGTGLGLGIVRKAAEAMEGESGVNSSLGAGATFWITFPKAPRAVRHPMADGTPSAVDEDTPPLVEVTPAAPVMEITH